MDLMLMGICLLPNMYLVINPQIQILCRRGRKKQHSIILKKPGSKKFLVQKDTKRYLSIIFMRKIMDPYIYF